MRVRERERERERERVWDGSLRDNESLRERRKQMKIDTQLYLLSFFTKFPI